MRISYTKGLLLALVALLMVVAAGVLVIASSHKEAKAQVTQINPTDGLDRAERLKVFKEVMEKSDATNPAEKNVARTVLSRATENAMKTPMGKAAGKAGLATAAIGVWTVVGFELKYAMETGFVDTVQVNTNVLPATGASTYNNAFVDLATGEYRRTAVTFQKSATWNVVPGPNGSKKWNCSYDSDMFISAWKKQTIASTGNVVWTAGSGTGGINGFCAGGKTVRIETGPGTTTAPNTYDGSVHKTGSGTTWPVSSADPNFMKVSHDGGVQSNGTLTPTKTEGPPLCRTVGCGFTHNFPTFKMGSWTETTLPSPQVSISGATADDFVDEVVTMPETPTVVPELPSHNDPFWTSPNAPQDPVADPPPNDNPNDPIDDPVPVPGDPNYYPNGPDADPDEDGVPNATDKYPNDPSLNVHPWEEMPERLPAWGDEPWHEVEPFGHDEYDGRIFGEPEFDESIYQPEDDMYTQRFKDKTVRETWVDPTGHVIDRYTNDFGPEGAEDSRQIWRIQGPGGGITYFYFRSDDMEDDWQPVGACADSHVGEHVTMRVDRWEGNGVYRIRLFSDTQDAHDARNSTTLCNNWYSANGQGISTPPDLTDYPEEVLAR